MQVCHLAGGPWSGGHGVIPATDHFADVVAQVPGQHGVPGILAAGHGVHLRAPQGPALRLPAVVQAGAVLLLEVNLLHAGRLFLEPMSESLHQVVISTWMVVEREVDIEVEDADIADLEADMEAADADVEARAADAVTAPALLG